MHKTDMRNAFLNALSVGKEKVDAIDEMINDITGVIVEANYAIASLYEDVSIKAVVKDEDLVTMISVHLHVRGDLISKKVMDVEINKRRADIYYVSWSQGKTPISKLSEFSEIFQSLFSSPTFLISIEKMIKSTE